MKTLLVVALVAVLCLAAQARDNDSSRRVMASSKTFVSVSPTLHRFCIPIGKKATGMPKELTLHAPRSALGLHVKLDSDPSLALSSPTGTHDKSCKKVSTITLVSEGSHTQSFIYAKSEIAKVGTISGFIVGTKPSWLSIRMKADHLEDVAGAESVCESVLGTKSESAFEHDYRHGYDENNSSRTNSSRHYFLRKVGFLSAIAILTLLLVGVVCRIVKRCRARRQEDTLEMGPINEEQEAHDLALALERSLADSDKKVVDVPQAAAPQFVFVPPQFMPASGAQPAGATPYVPMFAPQFMNYSLQEDRD